MDALELGKACVAIALRWSGRTEEALSAASGLVGFAEASPNPFVASFALNSYGMACSAHDPIRALDALRKGVNIAHDTGNRANESYIAIAIAMTLNWIEGTSAYDRSSLDYLSLADSQLSTTRATSHNLRASLGILATYLDRRGMIDTRRHHRRFRGVVPTAAPNVPEFGAAIAHLRDVLSARTTTNRSPATAKL